MNIVKTGHITQELDSSSTEIAGILQGNVIHLSQVLDHSLHVCKVKVPWRLWRNVHTPCSFSKAPQSLSLMYFPSSCSSRDEATDGRTHANDARAPNDETALKTHDGANQARHDPPRQIKVEMELRGFFRFMIFHMQKCCRLMSRGFYMKTVCRGNLLLFQIADGFT